jgi:hypothetical protein
MELINATRMLAGYTMGIEPSGRELLVVVIKGTFRIPQAVEPSDRIALADEQLPLVMADTFTGEPGFSAPVYEADFAPRKPQCDVLFVGSAYAPPGRQATRLRVGLRVGPVQKHFDVVGDRVWRVGMRNVSASSPLPFTQMPISYDNAFGGCDRHDEDSAKHDAYVLNPAGRGWHLLQKDAQIDGAPLPNTECIGDPVTAPNGCYTPVAFGALGRGWPQRACYAGTYDQAWLDHECPFLPRDFDDRYFQAAPLDQRIPIPQDPTPVELSHLNATGDCRFVLPAIEAAVHVFPRNDRAERHLARLDTILIEPDRGHCTLTWRYTRPLINDLFEIAQVLVGNHNKTWWLARHEAQLPDSENASKLEPE